MYVFMVMLKEAIPIVVGQEVEKLLVQDPQ